MIHSDDPSIVAAAAADHLHGLYTPFTPPPHVQSNRTFASPSDICSRTGP